MGLFDFLRDLFNPVKPQPGSAPKPPASTRPATPARAPKPDVPRPLAPGLPRISTPEELAAFLKTTPDKLLWLTRERRRHYVKWRIPKKHGHRTIEAPKKLLRSAQRAIHYSMLTYVPVADSAHGFRKGRSPKTNATPHAGKALLIKLDLRDFFWQVTRNRVAGLFRSLGYSRDVAAILWKLCCHKGRLPQGAPTSPALTNLCCRRMDRRLAAYAVALKGDYTRYADDLTFSFANRHKPLPRMLRTIKTILREEGFRIAPEKTRLLRKSSRQSVTGLTVNSRVSPPRKDVRALRALLHEARTKGAAAANRNHEEGFGAKVRGRIEAVRAIDAAKGEKFLAEYRQIAW